MRFRKFAMPLEPGLYVTGGIPKMKRKRQCSLCFSAKNAVK
jgi:hypothetical protein